MANVTRTIGSTTGSSSSIVAALTWGKDSANYDRSTDDILILSIVDDEDFDEDNNVFTGFTGTATASKYVRFEAAVGNECLGAFQNARISSNDGDHIINGCEDFLHIKNIAIKQLSSGSSDEGIRLSSGCNDVLLFNRNVLEVQVGGTVACDTPVAYPALIPADGTYEFTYTVWLDDDGFGVPFESPQSTATTVVLGAIVLPGIPLGPPSIQTDCAPCIITITP